MSSVRRVIVGASGSPGSLQALRYAQYMARDFDATLVPVIAWLPPDGDLADRPAQCPVLTLPPTPLAREARRAALARAFWHRTLTTDRISPHITGAAVLADPDLQAPSPTRPDPDQHRLGKKGNQP